MKRVIFAAIIAILSICANAHSSNPVLIQNGFRTSGSMNMYCESADIQEVAPADDGARWHLEQNNGIITFWIDLPNQGLYNLNKTQWPKDDAALVLNKMDNGMSVYIVANLQCRHLQIVEYAKNKWMVWFCTIYMNE